ncbi:hypothetical protein QBC34DRAFT_410137 [Podospora aff. communis PSN243]|uniref:Uncharacterized protein n=1 Tax=Podospora aff. communis PSN243 TaxID=3040156 RepID=A0AAV9GH53_9PEZI|nr:hypothetical protein QBC34DRAFT_410137 [Podospora aff. communis PSN243]
MNADDGEPERPQPVLVRPRWPRLADEESDLAPKCLSELPHPATDVTDILQHFLGCIEIHERGHFLDSQNAFWRERTEFEVYKRHGSRFDGTQVNPTPHSESIRQRSEQRIKGVITDLAIAIDEYFRRIQVLRRALSGESHVQVTPSDNLVVCVDKSGKAWRDSDEYQLGIPKVRAWRAHHNRPHWPVDDDLGTREDLGWRKAREIVCQVRGTAAGLREITDYKLEEDVSAHLVQFTRQTPVARKGREGLGYDTDPKAWHPPLRPRQESQADARIHGRFPHQHLSMRALLERPDSRDGWMRSMDIVSKEACDEEDPTRIKYIHIPSNNMEWIEAVVGRYYGNQTTKDRILSPELWRGQQHGSWSGPAHARYMRPLCERVSTASQQEENPGNVVLYMPFMDWEVNRTREIVSRFTESQTEQYGYDRRQVALEVRRRGQMRMQGLGGNRRQITRPGRGDRYPWEGPPLDAIPRLTTNTTFNPIRGIRMSQDGRLLVASPLGQYLMDAAGLYEAMSTLQDRKLIEKYLYNNPPLHPRRTLDQYHYRGLKSTTLRDRDQVVNRGTNSNPDIRHRLIMVPVSEESSSEETGAINNDADLTRERGLEDHGGVLGRLRRRIPWGRRPRSRMEWAWTDHWSYTDEHGCEHCTNDIKLTPKLIMVDQLWMWILDERTIITAFPGRYRDSYDNHIDGVHKSIRDKLGRTELRSVFDIALVILDECSTTFFNRTRIDQNQPQVLDIFSEAIGRVTNTTTISLSHVWHWGRKASEIFRSKYRTAAGSDVYVPLLDLHAEGRLLREVKDILDELDIMLGILKRQLELIRQLCKHVESIMDPEMQWRDAPDSRVPATKERDPGQHDEAQDPDLEYNAQELEQRMDQSRRKSELRWFRIRSADLLVGVQNRIRELEDLQASAKSTEDSVVDLLTLKQQQASVIQIASLSNAEESVRQGRAIMVFTVVTIVFLPLSFMSSVFGMNNSDFGDNTMTLRDQFRLIFPISVGIIALALVFAFYDFLRALVWSVYTYSVAWILIRTGLYGLWFKYRSNLASARLMQRTADEVQALKEEFIKAGGRKRASRMRRRMVRKVAMEDERDVPEP